MVIKLRANEKVYTVTVDDTAPPSVVDVANKMFPWANSDDDVVNTLSIVQDAAKKSSGLS